MRIATPTPVAVPRDLPVKSVRADRKERLAKRDRWLREIDPGCQFHLLLDLVPGVYFFAKNRQGEFMFLGRNNRERCHLKDDAAVIGLTDFDVNPPDLARSYVLDDTRIYATGEPLLDRVELWFDHLGIPDWFVVKDSLTLSPSRLASLRGYIRVRAPVLHIIEPKADRRVARIAVRSALDH